MERLGLELYKVAMLILPRWVRSAAGEEMRSLFAARQRETRADRGWIALPTFWLGELWGLARAGLRARRPPVWARRTAPVGSADSKADARDGPSVETVASDLTFMYRATRRRPATVLLCALTLSLGIGASTAMFSVVDSVLLKPLPYPEPDRLVTVEALWPSMTGHPTLGGLSARGSWSWPEYFGVAGAQTVFEPIAAYSRVENMTLRGDGPAERVRMALATWTLFPMLGAVPVVGRMFDAGDTRDSRVVLLSYGAWRDRYGADPAVVGRTLTLDDDRYTIVGVLSSDFRVSGVDPMLWIAHTGSITDSGIGVHGAPRVIGRLADGVTIEDAQRRITDVFAEILPPDHERHVAALVPRRLDETRDTRPAVLVMLGASLLLLLVALGNAAAILLGAGIDRERELAIRGAVGASRGRIVTQLMTESTAHGALAAVGGVSATFALMRLLLFVAPAGVPGLENASLNGTVLIFALLTAGVGGLSAGLVPALSLSSVHIAGAMGSARVTTTKRARLQSIVVTGELALATLLMMSALLLSRTVSELGRIEPGFDVEHLALVDVAVPDERFPDPDGYTDLNAKAAYLRHLRDEISAVPGVVAVAESSVPPLTGYRANNRIVPAGWEPDRDPPTAERRFVSANYFETAGVEIVRGRGFLPSDYPEAYSNDAEWARTARWAMVVSEGLAALAWPNETAVGKTAVMEGLTAEVVGVAANVRDEGLKEPTELAYYFLLDDGPMVVRTDGDPAAVLPGIRERVAAVDPTVAISSAVPMTELVSAEYSDERYRARLMTVFAVFAGVLGLMGIYGVTSRSVARRAPEMGLRLALGAKRVTVQRLVTTQAVRLALVGAAVGVALTVAGSSVLQRFLWGVSAADPLALLAVALGLPAFAAIAALGPARRATRVDPLEVLKSE